jgi:hypothetical protein
MDGVKDDVASSPSSSMGTVSMATLAVGLWFWMNIANNIELQEFHAGVRFGNDALILRLEAMTFVTLVQMAIGLLVGVCPKASYRTRSDADGTGDGVYVVSLDVGRFARGRRAVHEPRVHVCERFVRASGQVDRALGNVDD